MRLDELDVRRTLGATLEGLFSKPAAPVTIDRFEIEGTAGEGAMGRVYRARDPLLNRRVALKMIAVDAESDAKADRTERLLAEARALARFTHPNVVAVFAVGTVPEGVFIAMEYVPGETFEDWIARGPHAFGDAWPRLRDAGRGLAAAHALGVVHRDFKPANVLIGEDGSAKVADFGLAQVDANTVPSGDASPLAGTPQYMAPEQWEHSGSSARSDQYAFCLVVRQAVRSSTVPAAAAAALRRGTLADPKRRFPSMGALMDALEPRRGRFRRGAVALAAVAGLGLAVSLAGGSASTQCGDADLALRGVWDASVRARAEHAVLATDVEYSAELWPRVAQRFDGFADAWAGAYAEACALPSQALLDRSMACLADRRRRLKAAAATLQQADATVLERAAELASGLGSVDPCLDEDALRERVAAPDDPQVAAAVAEIRERLAASGAARRAGDHPRALELAASALDDARATGYAAVRWEAAAALGLAHDARGEYETAAARLQEAYAGALEQGQDALTLDVATTLVFVVGDRLSRADEAQAWIRAAEAWIVRRGAQESLAAARLHNNIGGLRFRESRYGEAREAYTAGLELRLRLVGDADAVVAESLTNVGIAETELGEFASAERHHTEALAIVADTLGPHHPRYAEVLGNLSSAQIGRGADAAAAQTLRAALAIQEGALGPRHPKVASTLANLGLSVHATGRTVEGIEYLERAIAIFAEALGPEHPDVGANLINLAFMESRELRHERALEHLRRAEDVLRAALGPDHLHVALALANQGVALRELGRYGAAIGRLERAVRVAAKAVGPTSPTVAGFIDDLATALAGAGRYEEALARHAEALKLFRDSEAGAGSIALTLTHLGLTHHERGAYEDALVTYGEALAVAEKAWPPDHPEITQLYIGVTRTYLRRGRFRDAVQSATEGLRRIEPDAIRAAELNALRDRALCRAGDAAACDR